MVHRKPPPDGSIRKRVFIQADPATVFHALTDAKALVRWFCDRASSNPREGGELTAYWRAGKSGTKGRAVFRRLEPDSLVELLWLEEGRGPGAVSPDHVSTYRIVQKRAACEVILTDQDSRPIGEETYASLDDGWNLVLLELKDFCEREERSRKSRSPRPK
ncbi:MAG: SRPBCC domain-containing protein [Acidobacteria bacterium]|nr:SRPBCC domain-containing protein [Acidobacteriota bacterium]